MKEWLFDEKELQFIREIKRVSPAKIWWDYTAYFFDYGDHYYQLQCLAYEGVTQNDSNEIVIVKLTRHYEQFIPGTSSKLVCEDKIIQDIFIVRNLVYFTNFKTYSKLRVRIRKWQVKVRKLLSGKADPWAELTADTIGASHEISCHPRSKATKNRNPLFTNLIDVGLMLQIDDKCLKAYIEGNGFGFHIWQDQFFFEIEEVKDEPLHYEFIKI